MAKLILSMDGLVLKEIPVTKERTTIGRKPHNDIQIDNLAVSGEHAVIVTILNDSFLEDLGSTNGTVVNGNPIKKHFLQNNDVVELGKYKLKFVGEAAAAVGAIQLLSGSNAGKELELSKPLTTLGKPGVGVAVLTRRPQGYFITHVEGANRPAVNGQQIGAAPHALKDHDVIELAGVKMEFFLKA